MGTFCDEGPWGSIDDFADFVVDTYLMVLAPETSVNLDLAGGFTFRF